MHDSYSLVPYFPETLTTEQGIMAIKGMKRFVMLNTTLKFSPHSQAHPQHKAGEVRLASCVLDSLEYWP